MAPAARMFASRSMLLPMETNTRGTRLCRFAAALDNDADVGGAAYRPFLVDAHADPGGRKLGEQELRDLLRQRFDQLKARFRHESGHALRNGLVIERILNGV